MEINLKAFTIKIKCFKMIIGRDIMAMSNNQKEYVNLPDSIIGSE